jgi:hypothetical protein
MRPNTTIDPCPPKLSLPAFEKFAQSVWEKPRWERGAPKAKTIAAARQFIYCSRGSGKRGELKQRWEVLRGTFYAHRSAMLWRERVAPFPGGGRWWALPYGIVICESGGNYGFPYGAYSILDPAWREWGGKTAHAGEASKREQDRVAHVGWGLYGEGAWECKGDGSTSWP